MALDGHQSLAHRPLGEVKVVADLEGGDVKRRVMVLVVVVGGVRGVGF